MSVLSPVAPLVCGWSTSCGYFVCTRTTYDDTRGDDTRDPAPTFAGCSRLSCGCSSAVDAKPSRLGTRALLASMCLQVRGNIEKVTVVLPPRATIARPSPLSRPHCIIKCRTRAKHQNGARGRRPPLPRSRRSHHEDTTRHTRQPAVRSYQPPAAARPPPSSSQAVPNTASTTPRGARNRMPARNSTGSS